MTRNRQLMRKGASLCATMLVSVLITVFAFVGVAYADDDGYPYAGYNGPGTNASQYVWTDNSGNMYSGYGYAYRNCTDFVAWKLNTSNGYSSTSGLGNAKDWSANAKNRKITVDKEPKKGSVAWWDYGTYGHVAWVESVDGDNVVIQEYNTPAGSGKYNRRTIKKSSASGYIHFKDLEDAPAAPAAPAAEDTTNFVKRVKKTFYGKANQLWSSTDGAVYVDEWWPGSNGISHTKVFTAPANEKVVDFDKITQPDGVMQNLYVATNTGVYEIWWNGHGYSNPAKIVNLANTKRVIADNKQSGSTATHRLYVLANDGPYEYWWRDGTGISNGYRLWNINNGIDMIKSQSVSGLDQVFVATDFQTYRMMWPVNGGVEQKVVSTLRDTVAIAKQNVGNTELFYTATQTGVHETWYKYDPTTKTYTGFSHPAKIVTVPSGEYVVDVKKRYYNSTNQLYVATKGHVYEYWWNATSGGVKDAPPLITISQNTIVEIDKSESLGYQQLYTAHKSVIYETWWGDGGIHTGEPIVSIK
ncbi:MAG: CHAP domain-containing protein [Candidatus Woesebacteria bacterium]